MKHLTTILLALLTLTSLVACQQEVVQPGQQMVPLCIALGEANTEVTVETRALPANITNQQTQEDFSISVKEKGGDTELNAENNYISSILVPAGKTYTIKAWYGDANALAINKPYYEGTAEVTIPAEIDFTYATPATITCRVANALLSVVYCNHDGKTGTRCFDEQFESYKVEATDGTTTVQLPKDQHLYFPAGTAPTLTFRGTRRYDSVPVAISIPISAVSAAHHLQVKLTISASGDVISISDSEKADESTCLARPFMNPLTD